MVGAVANSSETRARFIPRLPGARATPIAWAALALAMAVTLIPALTYDLRDAPPVGDQTSYITQALSLAYDSHTLDIDVYDSDRWRDMGTSADPETNALWRARLWGQEPFAMFFQRYSGGYAAAKPYGYSAYAAPFVRVFGPVPGFAIANVVLMVLLVGCAGWLASRRLRGAALPLSLLAFFFASFAYAYTYVAYTDLFLALVALAATGSVLRYADTGDVRWALVSAVVMGYGVSEKPQFAFLFLPLALVMMWTQRRRLRTALAIPAVGIIALALAVLPYLYYSDWKSFSPYNGQRFQLSLPGTRPVVPPWEGGHSYVSARFEASAAGVGGVETKADALVYTFVGEHTGILPFLPFAFLLLVAVVIRLRRLNVWAVASLIGIAGYLVFYAFAYPTNFYGGGQSFGNRYFLQMAPAVLVLALFAGLSSRLMARLAIAGIVLGIAFLLPNHLHANRAIYDLSRTSALQRLLPFEHDQQYASMWGGR